MLVLLALVVISAAGFGFWLGRRTGQVDLDYLASLETRSRALDSRADTLTRQLADARLTATIDAEAARSLRETISDLRSRVAGLREEVTFYKSLMAPSKAHRGLQIAEFELGRGERDHQYTFHILLTQAEERRSWVQGNVTVEVHGIRSRDDGDPVEQVLSLTDLGSSDTYPLPFRFRYFQNLSGSLTLPGDFEPRSVVVTMTPKGRNADQAERTFDWTVQTG